MTSGALHIVRETYRCVVNEQRQLSIRQLGPVGVANKTQSCNFDL